MERLCHVCDELATATCESCDRPLCDEHRSFDSVAEVYACAIWPTVRPYDPPRTYCAMSVIAAKGEK